MKPDKRVLKWVNHVRSVLRQKPLKKLPQGRRNSYTSCPIAHSLGKAVKRVKASGIIFRDHAVAKKVGKRLRQFVWPDGKIELDAEIKE